MRDQTGAPHIAYNPRDDHAAYIASWLTTLRSDPRAIFTAASKAQAIADWMHSQQSLGAEAGQSPDCGLTIR